jgi:hypothetical protein
MKRIIDLLKALFGLQLNSVNISLTCPVCYRLHEYWVNETEILPNDTFYPCREDRNKGFVLRVERIEIDMESQAG